VEGGDGLLAARLAAGDDRALAEAFDRLGPAVYRAALQVLGEGSAAQDVVQDVFVDLWRHPDRYDPAAGALRAYLTARARHRAVDLVRSELRRIARQQRHHRLTALAARLLPHGADRADEFAKITEMARAAGGIHHRFGIGDGFVVIVDEWETAGFPAVLRPTRAAGVHRPGRRRPGSAGDHHRRGGQLTRSVLRALR
jgi:RNA polymerase sigma factor (sigma-70 family)